jgi:hypothetical protein
MRLPNEVHESQPWRIRDIASDFTLEDVWALPVHGGAEDFHLLVELMGSFDPAHATSIPARVLWGVRDLLGKLFGLGRISTPVDGGGDVGALAIPGTDERSLVGRLPADLRNTVANIDFGSIPFVPLYRTDNEFAAEASNATMHGVLHLAWVNQGDGRYQGQMAVYVKPRGVLGSAYMAFIKPFRYLIVYPALMRQVEQQWKARSTTGGAQYPHSAT